MYDSNIIKRFADNLYTQATIIVGIYALAGFFIPVLLGLFFDAIKFGLIAGAFLALGGYFLGQSKAFQLKLQAQVALCQMKIEENTRALIYQNSETSTFANSKDPVRIFKGEKPSVSSGRTARSNTGTPVAINYRTCIKCLHQNPKTATKCSRCGYEFK